MRPLLLDLFCKAGGSARGYHDAGFDVVGVDIEPQPHYPYEFHKADAREFLLNHGISFQVIHASPPCQAYTNAQKIRGNHHDAMIDSLRLGLRLYSRPGVPTVIENVPLSPLVDPITLCGAMFGLGTYRHRLFESNVPLTAPPHPEHVAKTTKMGRAPVDGEFMHVVGNFAGVAKAREAMGIDWMTRDELREAIPPAYTHHIGLQLMTLVQGNNQ